MHSIWEIKTSCPRWNGRKRRTHSRTSLNIRKIRAPCRALQYRTVMKTIFLYWLEWSKEAMASSRRQHPTAQIQAHCPRLERCKIFYSTAKPNLFSFCVKIKLCFNFKMNVCVWIQTWILTQFYKPSLCMNLIMNVCVICCINLCLHLLLDNK